MEEEENDPQEIKEMKKDELELLLRLKKKWLENCSSIELVNCLENAFILLSNGDQTIISELIKDDFDLIHHFSKELELEPDNRIKILYMKLILCLGDLEPLTYAKLSQDTSSLNWIIKGLIETGEILYMALALLAFITYQEQKLPESELKKLDSDLIDHIISIAIEQNDNTDETLLKMSLKCLFCINYQFDSEKNPVVDLFIANKEAQCLGNPIIMILNRAEDSFSVFPLLKFLKEIFDKSADFFFTNDLNVLEDVLLTEIPKFENHQKRTRALYLEVLWNILKSHPKPNRSDEIILVVKEIFNATNSDDPDYLIAEQMILEIPLFKHI